MLTQSELKSILSYCPESGNFVWLIRHGRAHPGKIAGSLRKDGYVSIIIARKSHKAHRLAWLYVNGEWPVGRLDHEDNCQSNNRWDNIRLATHSQNMSNRKLNKNNSVGHKGIVVRGSIFKVYINKNGVRRNGSCTSLEEAIATRARWAEELHGEFARSA